MWLSDTSILPFIFRQDRKRLVHFFMFFTLLVTSFQPGKSTCFVSTREGVNFYQRSMKLPSPKHSIHHEMTKKDSESHRLRISHINHTKRSSTNRRSLIFHPSLFVMASIFSLHPKKTKAACLPGDIRSDCIGVYKMPLDDAALQYVETPEQLKKFAPDLNWVPPVKYPTTYSSAVTQIEQQRSQLDAAKDFVLKGDLTQAGLILLEVVPKISSAGKVILKEFDNALNKERNLEMKRSKGNNDTIKNSEKATTLDMKAYRFEYTLNELLGYLGETDVLIGQGLRGDLGVSAPAQIQILSSLDEARREFNDMLRVIPDKI